MVSETLKPCPFCGGNAVRITLEDEENFGGDVICCERCQASSHVEFGRKENLVDTWNKRAPTAAEQAEPAPAIDAPIGAIENGRVFLQRLVDHYDFQCEAGGLANCSDYHEAVRCFEAMAEWIYHGQSVRIEFQDALSNIANAYTAHGYSDAMDAVQNIKDIAKEALNAVR